MQLLAQLPIALKSIYADGWKLHKHHVRIKTLEEFANDVIKEREMQPGEILATLKR